MSNNIDEARILGRAMGEQLDLRLDSPAVHAGRSFNDTFGNAIAHAIDWAATELVDRDAEFTNAWREAFHLSATTKARAAYDRLRVDLLMCDTTRAPGVGVLH